MLHTPFPSIQVGLWNPPAVPPRRSTPKGPGLCLWAMLRQAMSHQTGRICLAQLRAALPTLWEEGGLCSGSEVHEGSWSNPAPLPVSAH